MSQYTDEVSRFPFPLGGMITMTLTERCNNNCAHCCINQPAECISTRENELSTRRVLSIIEEAASIGFMSVRFTGGEPLLRDDFSEIYLSTRRMGMEVLLFTNATLITPEIADMFQRTPPSRKIEVTLYGMTARSYEAVSRKPGSFEAAWSGIQLLLRRNLPVCFKGALLPANIADMNSFEEWISALPETDGVPDYAMNFFLRCRRDNAARNEIIKGVRMSPGDTVDTWSRDELNYMRKYGRLAARHQTLPGGKIFGCGLGICIDPYGVLFPCPDMRCPEVGYDLEKGSLRDAIERFQPTLAELTSNNPSYLRRCAVCHLRGLCLQCPATSWAEHGTLDTPVDYFCEVAHAHARFLGLLTKDEFSWEVSNWNERTSALDQQLAQLGATGRSSHEHSR